MIFSSAIFCALQSLKTTTSLLAKFVTQHSDSLTWFVSCSHCVTSWVLLIHPDSFAMQAGSERLFRRNNNTVTRTEGRYINLSLHYLEQVSCNWLVWWLRWRVSVQLFCAGHLQAVHQEHWLCFVPQFKTDSASLPQISVRTLRARV